MNWEDSDWFKQWLELARHDDGALALRLAAAKAAGATQGLAEGTKSPGE